VAGDGESEIRQVFEASDFSFSEDLFSMHMAWLWAIAALGMVVLSGIRGPSGQSGDICGSHR